MPAARALTGLHGKLPAHGDFVRRGLPASFCEPWDAWLQAGMTAARSSLGPGWEAAWAAAPAWRFALPAGACGPDPVAGILACSTDSVGRRFPLTLAAIAPGQAEPPWHVPWPAPWFALLEGALRQAQAEGLDADALAARLPPPGEADPTEAPEPGWWTAGEPGLVWPLPALPAPHEFVLLLDAQP
ncbi:type VI secretion system-associated protein TagF [Belnapia rosea]|uniref:type VI secretion system-associated protein TagF n=1 Tax=Belnapia rosea TaxID=938405 RepID=UPI000891A931|nr:type VI secretion system-associated protein TagF [Belnapia rosea]SDB68274.1 type VI secretion system protein ImpM [Belnapia rosea]